MLEKMQLFDKVRELGIKYDSHCSDLYLPVNSQTSELLKEYGIQASTFKSNLDEDKGSLWYDVPFRYLPYWYNNPNIRVNGYKIRFNEFWDEWQVSHDDIGANLCNSKDFNVCFEYAMKG